MLLGSCSDAGVLERSLTAPTRSSALAAASLPDVRISEIHYDNTGTDAGEAIEVSGPAGTDLTGWQLVLYNGSNGAAYTTTSLSGSIPATCGARGVVVTSYPVNGIQNGAPDGVALVDGGGQLVEFLSYEGTFAAVGGPADGRTSTDIGTSEAGTEPLGQSLQRNGSGVWSGPVASTFGSCNDNDVVVAGPIATVSVAPASASIVPAATQQFSAAAHDAAGTLVSDATFTWTSGAPSVASVDATGLATGLQPGDADIIATAPNGVADTATLHVGAAPPPPAGSVHISEIHYDNVSTDAGEAIEIEGPAGANVVGWSVVLYNGNGGGAYDTKTLNSPIPVAGPGACGARGVVVVSYPSNGIQNGSPDGMALVDATGHVVEFLSYEGTFTATNGAASGITSTDIGVSENPDNSVPAGNSLQRDASGGWHAPATSSFGTCNAAAPSGTRIAINELMADPQHAAGGASFGEWFEVVNYGTTPVDLQGWTITSAGQPGHVIASSVVVPPGGFSVLGRGTDITRNGGLTIDYNYFTGTSSTTIFLDATDVLVLKDASGATVDSVRWTNSSTIVKGVTRALRDPLADNANVDGANWGYSTVPFGDGDLGTPHLANGVLSTTPPAAPNTITFSGRLPLPTDPELPVGFEDQLFATLHDGSGGTVATTFTWTAETPAIASIDQNGVMHALAAGTAVFRATAADGTTATYALPTIVATPGTTAQYGNNAEFGEPDDADASDDFIVRRAQYTTSFNRNRGTPNWVSYDLDGSHIGTQVDRCDCFTFDPALPADFTHYTTADYTGAGAAAGYGIDRGHLARSFDRTTGALDNAVTYYFSNIVPQAADLNQGPWKILEDSLGDLARTKNKEVYIIAGVAGSKGTVKNEGKIVIPASTWKVAVILPRDRGLADVHGIGDLDVVAVNMPNDPGIRNVGWGTYATTVDAIEALTGYDLLALLPDGIEIPLEANDHAPVAQLEGVSLGSEGTPMQFSGGLSTDPDAGDVLTYGWDFGDGGTAVGDSPAHAYLDNGSYTVKLTVTDRYGLTSTATKAVTVTNAAPVATIAPLGSRTVVSGTTFAVAGSFTDAGVADGPWGYTVSWGSGTTPNGGQLADMTTVLRATHTYYTAGSYAVTFLVTDKDGATGVSAPLTVDVVRLGVGAMALPAVINLNERGQGGIDVVLLSRPGFTPAQVDPATATIAGVPIDAHGTADRPSFSLGDRNADGIPDLVLRFPRAALIEAGALDAATSELVVFADLRDGTQIEGRAAVRTLDKGGVQ